jgi:hypothetical protein
MPLETRTPAECHAKAMEMDALALTSDGEDAADFTRMAVRWRQLANEARWNRR